MNTSDYKRAAAKIQKTLSELHFLRADRWRELGRNKEQVYAFRDASHSLCRSIMLSNPKDEKIASKIARIGNFAVAMMEANSAGEQLKATFDFFNTETAIELRARHTPSEYKSFIPGGMIHRNYQSESEEQVQKRMEFYKSIFDK